MGMAEMRPGTALRQLRVAHAGLKKARQLMKQARENRSLDPAVLHAGWESVVQAHRLMAEIPFGAIDEAVLTQQLSVERYTTALLVRLRRLLRRENVGSDGDRWSEPDDEEDLD
jgi:hypothetical protein